MSVLNENISRINHKLQLLLKQYQQSQKETAQLKKELDDLKVLREGELDLVSKLERQVLILKSSAGHLAENDKKIFEKNIEQYIKEIDKCIRLLSE